MRNIFIGLLLLSFSTTKSQLANKHTLNAILTDVMQDSSFINSLAQINGMPTLFNYMDGDDEKQEIRINRKSILKEYEKMDSGVSVKILSFKTQKKYAREIAYIKLVFSDGTKASLKATHFSKNTPWFLTNYFLNGKNLEKGGRRILILKSET